MIFGSDDAKYLCVYNPADGEQMFVYKGDPIRGRMPYTVVRVVMGIPTRGLCS